MDFEVNATREVFPVVQFGNPEIILADEPTGNLDSKMGAEVMELLHRLNKEDGRTIVMVTHNEEQARQTFRDENGIVLYYQKENL